MPGKQIQYDMVIIGGGMVGAALACSLGDTGLGDTGLGDTRLRIAVVEGHPPETDWPADSYDMRVSAITRASQQLFERLGVWESMRELRVAPYSEMHVWDATGSGSIHFDCAEIGEPNLGHIIENRVITRALTQRLADFDNITLLCPATPQRLNLHAMGLNTIGLNAMVLNSMGTNSVVLTDGTELSAALIIGADGAKSWVREQAGIAVATNTYQQHAVVTTVKTSLPHRDTAWQRFLPTGPLAFLPLTEDYSSIVWSTSPEEAQRLLALDDAAFQAELAHAFEHKLGDIIELGPRASFPLLGRHAREYVKPGLALIGDAAHTIHPLAGQGVNLGFADVLTLAEVIRTAHATGKAIGSYKTLRRYERTRRGDNQLMLDAMGAFKTLFSNNTGWLSTLRNAGLSLTDQLPPVKHLFMRQALGLHNRP